MYRRPLALALAAVGAVTALPSPAVAQDICIRVVLDGPVNASVTDCTDYAGPVVCHTETHRLGTQVIFIQVCHPRIPTPA